MTTYSLSEFLKAIQFVVQNSMPDLYWIRAEVSSLSARQNGHCYMELVETEQNKDQSTAIFAAKVRANCWANRWHMLSLMFEEVTGQSLHVGMQILVAAKVDVHPIYGLSLTIENIDPTFTLGELAKQKQETLKQLEQDGIIDMQKSLQLPTLPRRIAVISSDSAAGYQDFIHQLQQNEYHFRFHTTLFAATMQGDSAPASIINALNHIYDETNEGIPYDCVVLIRGGGAVTDLSCFDQYELAAYCAQFPLPVISGIGHTRDISVIDRVAFESLKTPTAVAEYFIDILVNQLNHIDDLTNRLHETASRFILLRSNVIDRIQMRLQMAFQSHLQAQTSNLNIIEKTILLHSPERIFRMGYSLTRSNGVIVRDVTQLRSGDILVTNLANGTIESVVR
ncbi:MAG: exodeoxyribonuclease VII large subunit [Paludibacteraceae bacterium]|nr:exodeoxyribonuclease VII large subunit [Paludibacteraceae bacterium]